MKLRIRGDTLRLRLKRSEVDRLAAGAGVVEHTRFPGAVLSYRLETSGNGDFSAHFTNGSLVVRLPQKDALEWARTDAVSLHAEQKLPGNGVLDVLIEKDFRCLDPGHHRADEDDDDTFPHPRAGAAGPC